MTTTEILYFDNLIEVTDVKDSNYGKRVECYAEPFYAQNAAGSIQSKSVDEVRAMARAFGERFKAAMIETN